MKCGDCKGTGVHPIQQEGLTRLCDRCGGAGIVSPFSEALRFMQLYSTGPHKLKELAETMGLNKEGAEELLKKYQETYPAFAEMEARLMAQREARLIAQREFRFDPEGKTRTWVDMAEKHNSPPKIPLEAIVWSESGPTEDPKGRLLGKIEVAGVFLHLEAYEIVYDHDLVQQIKCWPEETQKLWDALGIEGAWHTIFLEGREYALIASPYC